MADFCRSCERAGMPGADDFAGWLAGRPGGAWAQCEGCGLHLLDDRGEPACAADGGSLHAPDGCPVCVAIATHARHRLTPVASTS